MAADAARNLEGRVIPGKWPGCVPMPGTRRRVVDGVAYIYFDAGAGHRDNAEYRERIAKAARLFSESEDEF